VDRAGAASFTELVARPERGRVFAQEVRAGLGDVGPSGRTRLDAIVRWLQDVAYADVEDAGFAEAGYWVVRRTRLRVERFPRFRERVRAETFASGLGRVWAERRTVLRGADGARADAVALWVFIHPESGRPMSVEGPMGDAYLEATGGRRVSARLRQGAPPAAVQRRPWRFRVGDLDLAGHVNNAVYWSAVEEVLSAGEDDPQALDAELEHRAAGQAGAAELLVDGPALWITQGDGEVLASAIVAPGRGPSGPAAGG
jgi:acyl-ACP thioesterase